MMAPKALRTREGPLYDFYQIKELKQQIEETQTNQEEKGQKTCQYRQMDQEGRRQASPRAKAYRTDPLLTANLP